MNRQTKRKQSVLCLAPRREGLALLLLRTERDSVPVVKSATIDLGLNLLTDEPELVSRKIRDRLDELGIRERKVVFLVPASWLLTIGVGIPEAAAEDAESLIHLQAERGFCYPMDELSLGESRSRLPQGAQHSLLVAVRNEQLSRLLTVAKGAKLTVTKAVPAAAMLPAEPTDTEILRINLSLHRGRVEMAAWRGGGLVALRQVSESTAMPPASTTTLVGDCFREIRLFTATLEGLTSIKVRVFGKRHADEFAQSLSLKAGDGMEVEVGVVDALAEDGISPSLLAAGLSCLEDEKAPIDFLATPGGTRLEMLTQRLGRAGLYAAAAALLIGSVLGGTMLYQHFKLKRLRSEYRDVHPKAEELARLRTEVKELAPWFRAQTNNLDILLFVTKAFPETGTVWATSIEMKSAEQVVLVGKARSEKGWLQMQRRLREDKAVKKLRILQVRKGKSSRDPISFTLSFTCKAGGRA